MRQAEFARLVGIAKSTLSEHTAAGRVVVRAGRVDPIATLARLEGHLDEAKRRAALEALGELVAAPPTILPSPAVEIEEPPPDAAAPVSTSHKARREYFLAKQAELDYRERVGQLIAVDLVAKSGQDVIATFCSELDRLQRADADEMASALRLTTDQARDLRRLVSERDRRLRRDVSQALGALADSYAGSHRLAAE